MPEQSAKSLPAEAEREAIALFEALLDVPGAERATWLDERTSERSAIRTRVEAMLAADRTGYLRTGGAVLDAVDDAQPPERLGGYRLLDRIGRGGMGTVYRAERDLGDFAHVAAIKIIKPGLISEALVDRFRSERQLLARLAHPGIARLFGGGETAEGAPFIIMELVDGLPLPAWLAANAPTLTERLTVFEGACSAVAFAHANLIAHRDITASNILVTRDGIAKLIDFGIARPLDGADGGRADAAQVAGDAGPGPVAPGSLKSLILTPGYSAPERRTGDAASTLADIFSLGRVFERILDPGERRPELRAIIARATAIAPADRYPTVEALAQDVATYRAGGAVRAYSGRAGYVAGKFIRRHALAVASSAAGVLLLIAALSVTVALYGRAETARRAEAARFEQLRSLAGFMVFDLNPRLARVVGNAEARLALIDRSQRYLKAQAQTPGATPGLRLEVARGLVALAQVQGVPAQPNLGADAAARANLAQATALLEASDMDRVAAMPALAEALVAQAMISTHLDADVAAGRAALTAAANGLEAVAVPARRWPWYAARAALRHAQLEVALVDQQPAEMLRLADRLEQDVGEWPADRRGSPAAAFALATADYHRGIHGYFTEALRPAIGSLTRAETRLVALDRATPNDPKTLYLLAWTQYTGYGTASAIDRPRAEDFLQGAEKTITRLLAIEPGDQSLRAFAGNIGSARAQLFSAQGRFGDAITEQERVVALHRQSFAAKPNPTVRNRIAIAALVLGNIHRQAGNRRGACTAYREAAAMMTQLKQRGETVGSVQRFAAGLASNNRLCSSGAGVTDFAVLE